MSSSIIRVMTQHNPLLSEEDKEKLLKKAAKFRTTDPIMAQGLEDIAHGRTYSHQEMVKILGL